MDPDGSYQKIGPPAAASYLETVSTICVFVKFLKSRYGAPSSLVVSWKRLTLTAPSRPTKRLTDEVTSEALFDASAGELNTARVAARAPKLWPTTTSLGVLPVAAMAFGRTSLTSRLSQVRPSSS